MTLTTGNKRHLRDRSLYFDSSLMIYLRKKGLMLTIVQYYLIRPYNDILIYCRSDSQKNVVYLNKQHSIEGIESVGTQKEEDKGNSCVINKHSEEFSYCTNET
jgi:hypothetical protein